MLRKKIIAWGLVLTLSAGLVPSRTNYIYANEQDSATEAVITEESETNSTEAGSTESGADEAASTDSKSPENESSEATGSISENNQIENAEATNKDNKTNEAEEISVNSNNVTVSAPLFTVSYNSNGKTYSVLNKAGKYMSKCYLLINKETITDASTKKKKNIYSVVDPSKAADYPNAVVVSFGAPNTDGTCTGKIYQNSGTGRQKIYWKEGNTTKNAYYFIDKSGKIKTSSAPYYLVYGKTVYRAPKNGNAEHKFTGFYQNPEDSKYYFAIDGTPQKNQTLLAHYEKTYNPKTGEDEYPFYTIVSIDELKNGTYSEAFIYVLDSEGVCTRHKNYTGVMSFHDQNQTYDENKSYFFSDGQILTGKTQYCLDKQTAYKVSKSGEASIFSGYFKNALDNKAYYAYDGNILTSQYVLLNRSLTGNNQLISASSITARQKAKIYCLDDTGAATAYNSTGIIPLYTVNGPQLYSVANGLVRKFTKSRTYQFYNKTLFTVNKNGLATIFSGIYKKYFYRNGKVKTAGEEYFVYYNKKLYKATKAGKLSTYKNTSKKSYYYAYAMQTDGAYYCVRVAKKSTKAAIVKNTKKTGSFFIKLNGKLMRVAYQTGRAKIFTGVYNKYYYSSGKILKRSSNYYRFYNQIIYKMNKSGKVVASSKVFGTGLSVVGEALKYLGVLEGSEKHHEIIDIYNNAIDDFRDTYNSGSSNYKVKYTDSWCATFVSAMFVKAKVLSKTVMECSCVRQVALWKEMAKTQNKKIWIEDDDYVPKPGDIIYYDWDDRGEYYKTDCVGWPEHVGIVIDCQGGIITVIEGNKSGNPDSVGKREIPVNGQCIRGFASPLY